MTQQIKNITPVKWNTDKPQKDTVVYVWSLCATIQAYWDGKNWRTPDGLYLTEITHWRPLRD